MDNTVYDYTNHAEGLKAIIPPMPDFVCRQAEGVYTLEPMTHEGRAFQEVHNEYVFEDVLRANRRNAMWLLDEIFDAGLRVV